MEERSPTTDRPESEPDCREITEEEARRIQREKNQAVIELLRSWRDEGDEEEQRQAFENLKKTLDENRLGYRKIYP